MASPATWPSPPPPVVFLPSPRSSSVASAGDAVASSLPASCPRGPSNATETATPPWTPQPFSSLPGSLSLSGSLLAAARECRRRADEHHRGHRAPLTLPPSSEEPPEPPRPPNRATRRQEALLHRHRDHLQPRAPEPLAVDSLHSGCPRAH